MDRAGPSEVLVSSTVKDLVVGSGIDFEERGAHELRGSPANGGSIPWVESRYLAPIDAL